MFCLADLSLIVCSATEAGQKDCGYLVPAEAVISDFM